MCVVSGYHIISALAPVVVARVSLAAGMTAMHIVNVGMLCTLLGCYAHCYCNGIYFPGYSLLGRRRRPYIVFRNRFLYGFMFVHDRAGRFREETAGKRTGPITRWPHRRLLFTRLEIVFVTISSFTKRTKVAQKMFQEG